MRDRPQILNKFVPRHTDTVVADREKILVRFRLDRDRQI